MYRVYVSVYVYVYVSVQLQTPARIHVGSVVPPPLGGSTQCTVTHFLHTYTPATWNIKLLHLLFGATMSETAQQLELIINMLKAQSASIEETKANLAAYQAKVTVLETKVTTLEFTVDALSADVLFLKEQINMKNQEGKLNNARLFGIPHCDEETKATDGGDAFKKLIYDRYIKPCLNAARANGDIPTVPYATNVISKMYRLGKTAAPGA